MWGIDCMVWGNKLSYLEKGGDRKREYKQRVRRVDGEKLCVVSGKINQDGEGNWLHWLKH